MILVTGGTGLLGSYLLLQLARKGKGVRALVRKNTSKNEVLNLFKIYEPHYYQKLYDSLEWVEGDILDIPSLENALYGISHVYHVAGLVSFNEKDIKKLYRVNVEGTKNLINLSIDKKVNKFCFISSVSTLDSQLDNPIITEQAEWNFKTIHSSYACSKYGAEMEVWRGSQEGLDVIIVNPGIILGSCNWERSSGLLYDIAMRNIGIYTSGTTGYVDAEDVAKICINLMEGPYTNENYILVGENASYEKVIQYLRKYFHKKPAKRISDFWLKKIAFFSSILPIKRKINKATYYALTGNSEYSNEKIKSTLNYKFLPLEESLKFHANNYLQYKKLKNE